MKDLISPITFNVPYQTTTLLSRVAIGRTTKIHGFACQLSFQGQPTALTTSAAPQIITIEGVSKIRRKEL